MMWAQGSGASHVTWPQLGRATTKTAHAGSRTRVTSMGGLYDTATLRALLMWGLPTETPQASQP